MYICVYDVDPNGVKLLCITRKGRHYHTEMFPVQDVPLALSQLAHLSDEEVFSEGVEELTGYDVHQRFHSAQECDGSCKKKHVCALELSRADKVLLHSVLNDYDDVEDRFLSWRDQWDSWMDWECC